MPTSPKTARPAKPTKPARPARSSLSRQAAVFAALADRTRLSLIHTLSRGEPQSITRLTVGHGLTRQAITKHLRTLGHAGLVRHTRHGRETRYAFNPAPLTEATRALESIAATWDLALARLKAFVESDH